jgi:hypothetical protein
MALYLGTSILGPNTHQQATVIRKTGLGSNRLGTSQPTPQTRIEMYRDIRKSGNATQYRSVLEKESYIHKGFDIAALSDTSVPLEIRPAAVSTLRDAAALLSSDHDACSG